MNIFNLIYVQKKTKAYIFLFLCNFRLVGKYITNNN